MALLARTIVVCEVRRGDKPAGNSAWLSVRSPGFRYIPAPSSFAAVTGLSRVLGALEVARGCAVAIVMTCPRS